MDTCPCDYDFNLIAIPGLKPNLKYKNNKLINTALSPGNLNGNLNAIIMLLYLQKVRLTELLDKTIKRS